MFGWRDVIHRTYGHATYYLMLTARDGGVDTTLRGTEGGTHSAEGILGVLPVAHLKHALFGNCLVSLPFVDGGGILADSRKAEESLLSEVVKLGRKTGARKIELRQERLLASCNDISAFCSASLREPLQ